MAVDATRLGMYLEWFETHRPDVPPHQGTVVNAAMSFSMSGNSDVMVLRIAMQDGNVADFHINPLIAQQLSIELLCGGQDLGWLDAKGRFVVSDTGEK
jgi:hypothetical protein